MGNEQLLDERIILKNSSGWKKEQVRIQIASLPVLTGDPSVVDESGSDIKHELRAAYQKTRESRPNDFNGPKVSVTSIEEETDRVVVYARPTDYFTIWGFPHVAHNLFQQSNASFVESHSIDTPCGLYSAVLVLTSDKKVVMNVISPKGGFNAGKLSFGFEEQTEPSDLSPVDTAVRGLSEEYGIDVPTDSTRVLGFGKPFNMAFVSAYCVIDTGMTVDEVVASRINAPDKNESACTLAVPYSDVDSLCLDEVPYALVEKYLVDGHLESTSTFVKHVANIPRWQLLQEFLQLQK